MIICTANDYHFHQCDETYIRMDYLYIGLCWEVEEIHVFKECYYSTVYICRCFPTIYCDFSMLKGVP